MMYTQNARTKHLVFLFWAFLQTLTTVSDYYAYAFSVQKKNPTRNVRHNTPINGDFFFVSSSPPNVLDKRSVKRLTVLSVEKGKRQNESTNDMKGIVPNKQKVGKELHEILYKHLAGIENRLTTIHESDLPVVGELYAKGKSKLCLVTAFRVPSSVSSSFMNNQQSQQFEIVPPLLEVQIVNDSHLSPDESLDDNDNNQLDSSEEIQTLVVDIGQITSFWPIQQTKSKQEWNERISEYVFNSTNVSYDFPIINHAEICLEDMYNSRVNIRRRGGSNFKGGLTKKDIAKISSSSLVPEHCAMILRKVVKAGGGAGDGLMSLLVNSTTTAQYLYRNLNDEKRISVRKRLIVGAKVLALDASLGGRFKRSPSIFVSTVYEQSCKDTSFVAIQSITVINGGYITLDESVRACTEAEKFAERTHVNLGQKIEQDDSTILQGDDLSLPKYFTASDERIINKLEILAMGKEEIKKEELEVDVREYLSKINLPITPQGAKQALVAIGKWTKNTERGNKKKHIIEPWSPNVLESAKRLANRESKRRKTLFQQCAATATTKKVKNNLEGRIDLTALPSVCIDAKRTTFRDDAIGLRLRSSTERAVLDQASKWELLIHIADVSDVFCPQNNDMILLLQAAESRGESRYDLNFGPLHLIPPVALEALALVTKPYDNLGNKIKEGEVNRCMTVWVYINERTGKIMDAGVERTLISAPLAFSYESLSPLLETKKNNVEKNSPLYGAQALILVASRLISKWNSNRLLTDERAIKRDEQLRVRELVSQQTTASQNKANGGSFQRTKAHRLVDNTLDLYGHALSLLLKRSKAPFPYVSGSVRLGTAPLRRYIDGMTQRQSLAVLCQSDLPQLTRSECVKANAIATKARNKMNHARAAKARGSSTIKKKNTVIKAQNEDALRTLSNYLKIDRLYQNGSDKGKRRVVEAVGTGRGNEVVLTGIGLVTKCKGVKGSLSSGSRVLVEVTALDAKQGLLEIKLISE